MTRKEYLESILTQNQIRDVEEAIKHGKLIMISGQHIATGKSTLLKYLESVGARAFEEYELKEDMFEIKLDKPLEKMDFGILDKLEN